MVNDVNDINKKNAYIDENGYLRWKNNHRLCHRDIAWKYGMRGKKKFGECDVHHKDGNKLNNNPENLELLTRKEHNIKHGNIIYDNGKKYIKLARISKIYTATNKAIKVAQKWIPRTQCIFKNGWVYITEWIWKKKGFNE